MTTLTDREKLDAIAAILFAEHGRSPKWQHGDAEWSPPDELGRVQLRYVEMQLVQKYGENVIPPPSPIPSAPALPVKIPRWHFIKEVQVHVEAALNCGQPFPLQNAARLHEKRIETINGITHETWPVVGDLPDTCTSHVPLDQYLKQLAARCAIIAEAGTVGHFYNLAHTENYESKK